MRIAYIDCFHGAAGDMLLASLLDAGLDQEQLLTILETLPVGGYRLIPTRAVSHQISGTRLEIKVEGTQPERSWAAIRQLIEQSRLPEPGRTTALHCFQLLAAAEASVHHCSPEDVHFHEVGAVDSIIDMIGFCAGLALLGIEQLFVSALPLSHGWTQSRHGWLPLPAPATLALLAAAGVPTIPAPNCGELVTPTAAALLTGLGEFRQPAMRIERIGYGLGSKTFDRVNGLRVWIGESNEPPDPNHRHHEHHHHEHHHHEHHEQQSAIPYDDSTLEPLVELRCNLDDASGELVAYSIERLLAAGALDAWAAPVVMKKGRPGLILACLARAEAQAALIELLLRETPTLGVRWSRLERQAAARRSIEVGTPWGSVRVKQKLLAGQVAGAAPEYEDCAELARRQGVALADVYAAALHAAAGRR